ncbi:MAG: ABC transporter ATP-binding protein [Rhodothalassiaceae bacterium]
MTLIEAEGLRKIYHVGGGDIHALDGVDLAIGEGEHVAIMGPSGSGKSTFMNMLGALDVPSSGTLLIDGADIGRLDGDALATLRNRSIGFVFQQFNLLPRANALQNVRLPLLYSRREVPDWEARCRRALERVGLGDRLGHRPNELSGGQQQRVAIARALVNDPKLLLADEPTGALDSQTSEEILALFDDLNREGVTIVLVTHDAHVAAHAHRQVHFLDGRIVADERARSRAGDGQ